MSYSTFAFLLLFLVPVFLVYTVIPKRFKWVVLLTASYIFYWLNSNFLVVALLLTTVSVYVSGLLMNKIQDNSKAAISTLSKEEKDKKKQLKAKAQHKKRAVCATVLTLNFGLLIFLKYFNFLAESAFSIASIFGFNGEYQPLRLLLPLGISFYTLSAASYVIDVCRGKYRADTNFSRVALFLSFFPQIVEGPVARYDTLANQLYEGKKFDYEPFTFGLQLIFWGLLKKVVIADRINGFVGSVFDKGRFENYSGYVIVAAMLLYTLQLYAEFSGCMDIVTGVAQLFGVKLDKNFDRPFFSKSINEFWRRWHITLGTWLRDYIFYSVSLSKVFANLSKWARKHMNKFFANLIPAAFALLFVWLGNGFWHGSSWKYVCYGLYYYVLMLLGMLCEPLFKKICGLLHINRKSKGFGAFAIARTFIIVNIGMMMFRAETLTAWFKMLKSMFVPYTWDFVSNGGFFKLGADQHDFAVIIAGFVLMLVISLIQEKGHSIRSELAKTNIAFRWSVYMALVLCVIIFGAYGLGYGTVAFIYGQF